MYAQTIPINKPIIGNEELRAAANVLRSGFLTEKMGSGPYVTRFETTFAKYVGTRYAVAVNNGTSALHAALLAAGVGLEDEVIVPSLTFVATAEAVALTGARPVFADIDAHSYCLDPAEVRGAINERTKAIIPVHLYGLPADMDPIMEVAHDHGVLVIEDAAQAHGAEYGGQKAGALGDMACFSFYGSKNMTTGEGGMITTNSREYADAIGLIRNHGEEKYYQSVALGHNYRMPEVAAAIGCEQLLKLPRFLEARQRNAKTLLETLADLNEVQLPQVPEDSMSAWYVFTLRVRGANAAKRNKVLRRIRERRVGAQVYYPKPVHKMPYYQSSYGRTRLPKTETAARQVFSLPVHPSLSENDVTRVVAAVKDAVT